MCFEQYIFNQGEVVKGEDVAPSLFEKYRTVLPDRILVLWQIYGFSGVSDGLLWLTDPEDFARYRDDWEGANDILALGDQKTYLVARSAFGDLLFYIIKDDGNHYFSLLDVHDNKYTVLGDSDLDFFFDVLLDDETFAERCFAEALFKQCLEKLGPLAPDECYGFSPVPALGGDKAIAYADKVKMKEYLSLCAQTQM